MMPVFANRYWGTRVMRLILLLVVTTATFPSEAFAYFDPNAGGMLFQMLSPVIFIAATMMLAVRGGIRSVVNAVKSAARRLLPRSGDSQREP
jgi:hypothetical protein